MKKIFYFAQLLLLLFAAGQASAQANVLDPNDPDLVFTSSNQPPAPAYGLMYKWGHTNRLNWNPYSLGYKSYYFKGMAFRLKFPKSYQAGVKDGKKYPMLLFLHGLGEVGTIYDNELQLLHGGELHAQAINNSTFDGFLVYPQSSSGYLQNYFGAMTDLIDSMVKYVKLDLDRVTVGGLSSGGQATWDMLQDQKVKYFASATPISAAQNEDVPYFNNHITLPFWVSNGGKDQNPTPETATDIIDTFRALGGNIIQSFYPSLGHGVWYNFWGEPGYFPFLNAAHKANPLVYFQRNQFCPSDPVNVKLGLQAGFYAYEWQKDNVTIAGATTNNLTVTAYGTYKARFKRTSASAWSEWSPAPVVISQKQATVTPPIQVNGLHSIVLPAPDGSTTVPLMVPNTYASYEWRRISDNALVSTTNTYTAPVGQYKIKVTELYGCSSSFSAPFTVIAASGTNLPDKATNLSTVALTNSSMQLNWFDNPTPLYNETAFEVYRSTTSGGNYTLVAIKGSDVLSHVDQSLQPNTKYYYIVRAINNNGAAPVSVEASASTKSDTKVPTAPSLLVVSGTTRTSVSLSWNASTDDVGIDRYDIYINGQKSYTTAQTSYTAYNLDSFKTYSFYVRARDVSGNTSTPSNQVSATTKNTGLTYKYYEGTWNALPDFNALTPVKTGSTPNVDISVRNQNDNFGFLWQGYITPKVTGSYKFETNSDDGSKLYFGTYSNGATALVNNDGLHGTQFASGTKSLTAGVTYAIAITYFDQAFSNVMEVYWTCAAAGFPTRTLIASSYFGDNVAPGGTAPVAPGALTATATAYNKINLSWTDNSSNETGFEIYRKANADPSYSIIGTTAANITAFIDSTVAPVTTYKYKVLAVNTYGQSAYTSVATATTPALPAPPASPTNLTGTVLSSSKISLTWNDNSNNETGFELYRSLTTNANYLLLKTFGSNATSQVNYVDSGLYANVTYYYKVRAIGIGGSTSYTNEISKTTLNNPPTVSPISNVVMRYSSSKVISISATDVNGDPITFSVTGLPSFAILTNTGYGTANITFNPGSTQQGSYPMQVIASDNHGGSGNASFTLTVNSNYSPVVTPVNPVITIAEGSTNNTNLTATDQDGNNGLVWSLSGAPSFVTLIGSNGSGVLTTKPGYAHAGSYQVTVIVTDALGATGSTVCTINVTNANPASEKVYVSILNSGGTAASSPWNNITGVSTNNLLNSNNQSTTIGLQFLTTAWNTYNQGAVTGNNSGVYPDNVIRDYYYFGIYGAPNTVDFNITGLSTTGKYDITLFGSSVFTGAGDNGSTVYTINGVSKSLNVQNNQQNTVTFASISPNASGIILVGMSKAPGAPVGYLNALVIDKPFDDGTAPVLPTNLSAEVLSNGGVQLEWTDLAYNESAYQVYRSTNAAGPYTLLNPGASNANDTTYTDNSVASRVTYYYKIQATNSYGVSGQTAAVSATTINKAPVLNAINSVFVKATATATVNINATDDAGEILTVTVTNLPSFGSYQNNGNGTGVITFSPSVNDLGIYNNITVKVDDNYGGSITRTFSVNVADNSTRSIYVNFGPEGSTPQPAPWNNYLAFPFANQVLGNLVDDANVNTGYSLKLLQQWTGNFNYGMVTGDNSGIFPDNVMQGSIYSSVTTAQTLQFNNLNNAKKYNIVFLSSFNAGADATVTFASGSQSVTVNGRYNSNKTVQLNGLAAVGGIINITITKGSSAQYVNLNAVVIQEYDNATPLLKPVYLFVESDLSSNKVKLTWADRSYNETGYEIWRSTSSGGTYSLIASVAANTTTYTNITAVANTRYYYKVRAANGGLYSGYSNVASIVLAPRIVYINLDLSYPAASPWNNTDAPPITGATFSDLKDNALQNTGFEMVITQPFNGEFYAGVTGGGIFPDNVMKSNYWTDAGQVSQLKFGNLDQRKRYRVGMFGSADWSGYFFANYTINGKTVTLNSYKNNSKVVYLDNLLPNANGELVLDIATADGSPYSFTGAITIEYYVDPTGGTGNRPMMEEENNPSELLTTQVESQSGVIGSEVSVMNRPEVLATRSVGVKAYPNPFVERINIELGMQDKAGSVAIIIFDANSNIVYRKNIKSATGNQLFSLPMAKTLPAGTYILKVYSDGVFANSMKLVKSR